MIKRIVIIVAILLCFIKMEGQDYFSIDNILKYATYLEKEGDYSRAATEYLRAIYLIQDTTRLDSLYFQVARCYRKADNFEMARKYYNYSYSSPVYADQSKVEKALLYTQQGHSQVAVNYIDTMLHQLTNDSLKASMQSLKCINYIYMHQWDKADSEKKNFPAGMQTEPKMVHLAGLIEKGKLLKYKDPCLAGVMSAIVPGSGKLYTGRKQDALASFLLVGISGWQAYDGFTQKGTSSIKGWVFLTVGSVFYVGNIYGSVVSARIYNRTLEDNVVSQLDIHIYF
jgi:tetratricopeptide (TPR) repeat protein